MFFIEILFTEHISFVEHYTLDTQFKYREGFCV